MTDQLKNKDLWDDAKSSEKSESKETGHNVFSIIVTVALTAVIIAAGFMLPTLLYPYLDSYSDNLTVLVSPEDDTISSHVFEKPVTLYPWDIIDGSQLRGLTTYEMDTLQQSGVAELLVSNMQLRGMQQESDPNEYIQRILNDFRCLESSGSSEPGCFVLVDEDIDLDGEPDVRCAVDFDGTLISLLFVSQTWASLDITAPIAVSTEQTGETAGAGGAEGGGEMPTRPSQEEENIWLFSYVISREALVVGQMEVFSVFRQLDLKYEERFKYPFINLISAASGIIEGLPEIELMTMTTHQLVTENYDLRIYDFSDGTRLILYINPSNQYCDGFNLSTVPI